ncbi:MAG: hypothetical protein PUB63_00235 [Clostridia bacterium]|nr:hypothetical protein [Clostridia bacterium]
MERMIHSMTKRLRALLPVGMDAKLINRWLLAAFIAAFLLSLGAPLQILSQRDHLFTVVGGVRVYQPGMMMPDYHALAPHWLVLFPAIALSMPLLSAWFYFQHWQDGRSIYTMRRLPDRWELHRRCLTVPVAAALLALLMGFGLLMLYYLFYLAAAPEGSVSPGQLHILFDELTGGIL